MADSVDFYFDLRSPFVYLALQRLPGLAARFGYAVDYKVVDLAALKRLAGNTGPGVGAMPLRLRYAITDQRRWARRYGVPIDHPPINDSSRVNRGFLFARACGRELDYLMLVSRRAWGEGAAMIDPAVLADVARSLDWDPEAFVQFSQAPEADAQLDASTLAAHRCGVFGVPTMMIDGEMWWGNDRLDFVEEFMVARAAAARQPL
jgi:2-hydroxychromene-2-carboxylate isomerase